MTYRYRAFILPHVPDRVKFFFPSPNSAAYSRLSTFADQVNAGLTSESFDIEANIHDGDSRRSLLATKNLWKPIIVICATRESASRLRSGPLGRRLPATTQYLWLPIGPAKLAAALAVRRKYCMKSLTLEITEFVLGRLD